MSKCHDLLAVQRRFRQGLGRQGSTSAEVMLPTVEPVAISEAALQIVWHRCALRGCVRSVDARHVEGRADSDGGQLTLQP